MTHGTLDDASSTRLFDLVHGVRRRWRLARVLRGAAVALAGLLATVVILGVALDRFSYPPALVVGGRVLVLLVVVSLIAWYVVRPLLPRPQDATVALYFEEHAPSLDGALISAVEVSQPSSEPAPPVIAAHVRRAALQRSRAVADGRGVDGTHVWQASAAFVAGALVLVLLLLAGPEQLRHGMAALLTPWQRADAANPYRVDVTPGDATVARGATVVVAAHTVGFEADAVEVVLRRGDSTWRRQSMSADSSRRFTARLLDVASATDYYVETNGIRSRVFHLDVADLPYARRIDLEYHFPPYTGLPVQHVDSAGDIAALAGTVVHVRVTPTVRTSGGRLVVDGGDTLRLSSQPDGSLTGTLKVVRNGFYRVELESARGDLLTASLDYAIDVLPDRPPVVQFKRPGRDSRVLAVDEVYAEARAEDDYGVARVDLVYSVNGAAERTVRLHEATSRVIRDIAAGHTFMLEEYQLQPGDVVSYYARATDNDAIHGGKSVTSDIYFLQVRPYAQEYRQAQEGGGGQQGGEGEPQQQLSQRQREIIAATFNSARDSAAVERRTIEENAATLRIAQQRLREDVQDLGRRIVERGVVNADSGFARIAEMLPIAAAAMDTAERALTATRLRDALPPEQRALQQLQRAEAVFRQIRVSMGGGAGGGGGASNRDPEDLADLFELQRERMRNQYETVQRGGGDEQERQNKDVDATAERLRQLAARQQQENERARRKADSLSMAASGARSGDAQRQLAQDAEQAARQLERLARERQSQSLADAARRLNEAADAMRRSAASQGQASAASSAAALDRLREAARLLDEERNSRVQRAADDAAATGRRLQEEQRRVTEDVAREGGVSGAERDSLQQRIADRKGAMADTTRALADRLDRTARDAARDQRAAANKLQAAGDTLRARRIQEKLRATQSRIRDIPAEAQQANERIITSDIEQLNRSLDSARVAARSSDRGDARRTAELGERARDLVRGMESADERARQTEEQRSNAQRGEGGTPTPNAGQSRQSARELRERLNDARALRRDVGARGGVDASQLDGAIRGLERLAGGTGGDPRAERELRAQVIEGLRAFEFTLTGTLGDRTGRVLVDRSGEIPPQYRRYVEEYYRSLGRAKPR